MYTKALIIGRFQPFHNGHLFLIKNALKHADKISIGIGSANIVNENNPFSYDLRREMIQRISSHMKWDGQIDTIFPSNDVPDDNIWLQETLNLASNFDVVISNNNWVTDIFSKNNYTVLETGLFQREELEGKLIRDLMNKKDESWKIRVPSSIHLLLSHNTFHGSRFNGIIAS
ncbi:MAG: adenylyltransferase/cytidyltransferase family protein [Candidatus Roizmanbacteria bacterium]